MAKNKKKQNEEQEMKILDVDASMQGTITFHDPVNLRINGDFKGKLDTKGSLSVGENASVHADITGDNVVISGKVVGNIVASESLSIVSPGNVVGDISAPVLAVTAGAYISGRIEMSGKKTVSNEQLSLKQVAQYLEVETSVLEEWAQKKQIPAEYSDNSWQFQKADIDKWIQEEKVKL